jgi:hypothetical protein
LKRESVDFHEVPAHQDAIHGDLLNWAIYVHSGNPPKVSAMFRDYKPERSATYNPPAPKRECDWAKAMRTNGQVRNLPTPNRLAVQWYYVQKDAPAKAIKRCETSYEGLALLVIEARDMMQFVGA